MKKYLIVIFTLFALTGCNDNSNKNVENSNSNDNSNIIEESNLNSNEISNVEIDESNINVSSNVQSNSNNIEIVSNKQSNVTSNKVSSVTSNKTSNVTVNSDKTGTTSKGYKIERKNGIYYINGILLANKTYDLPSTYDPGNLTSEFKNAFNKLKAAAQSEGISIWVQSGYRSYDTQKTLYNRYVARDGKAAADRYSARPGYSEHQSGLAADFNEISDTFGDTKAGKWLSNNCWKYGFILRYPKGKEQITGYMYESWHFRYIGNVEMAKEIYNNGNWSTLEEYFGITSKYE